MSMSMYRQIFISEFNIAFHKPKKDRCDLCEAYKQNEMDQELKSKHGKHVASKLETKEERTRDRNSEEAVVCFDMQNVIALPRANISSFFYKRKLNVYNLTGHLKAAKIKESFCCIWTEKVSGRTGNDIASALIAILNKIQMTHPEITKYILWSDSCVPQNKNCCMSLAILKFMEKHAHVVSIEQKYCEAGHSSIQEVDNLHSQIEKKLGLSEIYSPLSLVRLLMHVNDLNPFNVIQLRQEHIADYKTAAKSLSLAEIPTRK